MTRPSKRELESDLERLGASTDDTDDVLIIDFPDGESEWLSPGEYEQRYGHPPSESEGVASWRSEGE